MFLEQFLCGAFFFSEYISSYKLASFIEQKRVYRRAMEPHRLAGVKVPSDKHENRALKAGFEEDDNEDIAYLNFALVWYVCFV